MMHCEMMAFCFLAQEAQLHQACVLRKHHFIAPRVQATCSIDLQYQLLFAASIYWSCLFPIVCDSPSAKIGWENAWLCLKRL